MRKEFCENFNANEKRKGIVLLIIYIVTIIFGTSILKMFNNDILLQNQNFVWYSLLTIIIVIFYSSIIFKSVKSIKKDLIKNMISLLGILLVTFILIVIVSIGISCLGIINANQVEVNRALEEERKLILISACFLAPITEEIIYRYLIFRAIREHNILIAHIGAALLFGFCHVWYYIIVCGNISSIIAMFPTFVIGLGCSIIYEKTKNITYPILLHMILNIISTT